MSNNVTARNAEIVRRFLEFRSKGMEFTDAAWAVFEQGWGLSWDATVKVCRSAPKEIPKPA